MRLRSRRLPVLATIVLTASAVGCSGSDPDLLDHLPRESLSVTVSDLAAVRAELGLPEDADVLGTPALTGPAGTVLVHLTLLPPATELIVSPLDHRLLTTVAHARTGRFTVVLVATSQPFESLAAGLDESGYRRDGDLLVSDAAPGDVYYPAVGRVDDGVVALGPLEGVRFVTGDGELGVSAPMRGLLDAVDAPTRSAVAADDGCLAGLTTGDVTEGRRGEIVLTLTGPADAGRVETADLSRTWAILGDPVVDGNTVRIPVEPSLSPLPEGVPIAGAIASETALDGLYRC